MTSRNGMNRRRAVFALASLAFMGVAGSQSSKSSYRVVFLDSVAVSSNPRLIESFRAGLRELGYVEGQNLSIEILWANGGSEQLREMAAGLVKRKVDVVLVSLTGSQLRTLQQSIGAIPIVTATASDPVATGIAKSLARPGGGVTGMSLLSPELSAKRLSLLKELIPGLSRVGVLYNKSNPGSKPQLDAVEGVSQSLGLKLSQFGVTDAKELENAIAGVRSSRAEALLPLSDAMFAGEVDRIVGLASKHRLPAIYWRHEFAQGGGLLSYGPSFPDLYKSAAAYVDKILKGAKPGDLPMEQPTRFELVVNLKSAKSLGIMVPRSLLLRSDRVIE